MFQSRVGQVGLGFVEENPGRVHHVAAARPDLQFHSIYYRNTTGINTVLNLRSIKQYVAIIFPAFIISLKRITLSAAATPLWNSGQMFIFRVVSVDVKSTMLPLGTALPVRHRGGTGR